MFLHITFQDRADLPDASSSFSVELPKGQLHVEEGHPGNNHEEQVGYQEGTCAQTAASEGGYFHYLHVGLDVLLSMFLSLSFLSSGGSCTATTRGDMLDG